MAGFLFILGVYVLCASCASLAASESRTPAALVLPLALGLFAGFLDAAGGGGWGPIGTPALLSSGRLEPRKVIGSVDTGEFLVALGASAGFLVALPLGSLNFTWVGAILVGGLVAAPLAAYFVRHIPARILGAAAGGLILITNFRTLAGSLGIEGPALVAAYLVLAAVWAGAIVIAIRQIRAGATETPAEVPA